MSVLGGNCVGGGSVVYFATMPRAPRFVFERHGSIGRRMWPAAISRDTLEPVVRPGGRGAAGHPADLGPGVPTPAACSPPPAHHAGRTANPAPSAIDVDMCTNCNWMMAGCRFDAKRSLLLNYLPAALAHGAEIRPLHEVQHLTRNADGGYRVHYRIVDDEDYRILHDAGTIDAKIVVLAAGAGATPVILQRSEADSGPDAARRRPVLLRQRRAAQHRGVRRGPGPRGARPVRGRTAGPTRRTRSAGARPSPAGTGSTAACPSTSGTRSSSSTSRPAWARSWPRCPTATGPSWFGAEKKEMLRRWQSWLTIFTMSEDDNEGVFGPPPETGNAAPHLPADARPRPAAVRADGEHLARLGAGRRRRQGHPRARRAGPGDAVDQRPGRRVHRAPAGVLPHRRRPGHLGPGRPARAARPPGHLRHRRLGGARARSPSTRRSTIAALAERAMPGHRPGRAGARRPGDATARRRRTARPRDGARSQACRS